MDGDTDRHVIYGQTNQCFPSSFLPGNLQWPLVSIDSSRYWYVYRILNDGHRRWAFSSFIDLSQTMVIRMWVWYPNRFTFRYARCSYLESRELGSWKSEECVVYRCNGKMYLQRRPLCSMGTSRLITLSSQSVFVWWVFDGVKDFGDYVLYDYMHANGHEIMGLVRMGHEKKNIFK